MVTSQATKQVPLRDLRDWLTREQACDLLGVSYNTIGRWERAGKLHPQQRRSEKGHLVYVYEPAELARMPARERGKIHDPGETCARVFELLDRGHTLREIVIRERLAVNEAEELRERWLECGSGELAIAPAQRAELVRVLGPFETIAELVERVLARLEIPGAGNANAPTPGVG